MRSKLKGLTSDWKFLVVISFITILFSVSLALFFINNSSLKSEILSKEESRIEDHYAQVLNRYFDTIEHIEIFYVTLGPENLSQTNFEEYGDSMDFSEIGFVSFSIAPDGIMEYYYSYDYGDDLIGLDLINDERDHDGSGANGQRPGVPVAGS